MRFLFFTIAIILFVSSFGCKQSTNSNKSSELQRESPISLNENGNDRLDEGKLVYDRKCKVCHQVNRMGMPKVYPPLKNTKNTNGNKDFLIEVVLNGMSGETKVEGVRYDGLMPSYRDLNDQQIADVLNYIRSDGKASSDLISAEDVRLKR